MARTLALVLSLLLAAGVAAGDQSPLATFLLADQRTLDDTRELTASIGPRLTGSAAYERAAEWSAQRLRAAGLDRVMLEPFTLGRGWERELARARIIAPIDQMLHVAALGWTPSTAEGGVEGDVVALTDLAPETIARRTSLRGRIVLLPDGERGGTPDRINAARRELDARLRDAGVRALLSADGAPDNVLSARDRVYGGTISALPAAQIGREDAQTIRRLLNRGPIRIAIELRNRITDAPVTVHNVVGDAVNGTGDVATVLSEGSSGKAVADSLRPGTYRFQPKSFQSGGIYDVPALDGPWWFGGISSSFVIRAGATTNDGTIALHAHASL